MVSPEHVQSCIKQDRERSLDLRGDKDREEREGDDGKKHRSSKSKKPSNEEATDGIDYSGRKTTAWNGIETRKRSSSDDDDCEARKESRPKQIKRNPEESSLEKLSNWYQDRETDTKHDGPSRQIEGKDERSSGLKLEKVVEKDSRYIEARESSRERGRGTSGRNSRRRWDEVDAARNGDESLFAENSGSVIGKSSDPRNASANIVKFESDENKTKGLDSNGERGTHPYDYDMLKNNSEGGKKLGWSDGLEVDKRGYLLQEEELARGKFEEHRQRRNLTSVDGFENHDRTNNADDNDNSARVRDKSRRDIDNVNRSRTPERARKALCDSDNFEVENERSNSSRWKDVEKDSYRDDRSKRRDDNLNDKNRDCEVSKDMWKRRQGCILEKERKDEDIVYDYGRDWASQRRGRDRYDNERSQGRTGARKDGNRTEAVKTSSKYGISNENYDVIEIQTKPFCYGKDESRSSFSRRVEGSKQSDMKLSVDHDFASIVDDNSRRIDSYPSGQHGDDLKDGTIEDGSNMHDQSSWRDEMESRGQKSSMLGHSSSSGPHRNEELGPFTRSVHQGVKGNRVGRGGRGRPGGRDSQQVAITVPMLGSPMGPLGMPPRGAMQPLPPNMSPAPGSLVSPGVVIPPFLPPVIWPGARGFDMNTLAMPPGLSPVPPGPLGSRFSPNIGTPPNPAMYFDQVGLGRGLPPNISGSSNNSMVAVGHGQAQDKAPGGWATPRNSGNSGSWATPRNSGPPGKAPSRGEQNDYSQNFVDTGMRPQNFIRELEPTSVVEDYPKLRELIQKKDEIVFKSASPPMYHKCDLHDQELSPEFFGTKFDVILVDPPWEEYVHRAPGVTDHMDYWTFEEIMNLKIEAIADTPSFIFLWVGDGLGLEQGRQCLKKWGFRRCEDICWVKTNKTNATPGLRHDSHTLFQRSKEHCLMGIKGTVRRSIDGHIIHANIDTDVIIAEEPPYGSTAKPEDMYRIVEHFALGRRRLELFGEDHNIRSGWLTVGKGLSSSNFNAEAYVRNFGDKDGKVWQGGGGRNPPPDAPHLVKTTPEIEALRPKSPMRSQQQAQQQQQSASISLTTASSSNRRPAGNSPQSHTAPGMNQEASSFNPSAHWVPQVEGFRGLEGNNLDSDDRMVDVRGYDLHFGQANDEYMDFDSRRAMNMM